MKISVLTVTYRLGHLDLTIDALKGQNFTDFEWLFVDELFDRRQDAIKEYIGNAFPFWHVLPRETSQYTALASAMNTGLIYAEGKLVCFMHDYVYPHPEWLQRHWEIYQQFGPSVFITGPRIVLQTKEQVLSALKQPITAFSQYPLLEFPQGKAQIAPDLWECSDFAVTRSFYAGRNDSVDLNALVAVNGFNERHDKNYGLRDMDLAARLKVYGCHYLRDGRVPCFELPHARGKGEIGGREDPNTIHNLVGMERKPSVYRSTNSWSLEERRKNEGITN